MRETRVRAHAQAEHYLGPRPFLRTKGGFRATQETTKLRPCIYNYIENPRIEQTRKLASLAIIVRPSFRKCTAFPFLRRCPIFQSVLIGMHVVYILSSKVLYNFCSHPSVAVMDAQQKREARLSRRRERKRRLRASESAEQRESRLAKRRVRDTARRATQSTVQRERALQQRRERFTDETTENREARLETVRQRITSETSEEREARLQQLILNQQQRLATESQEEREARLQQLILNQQQRLATESQEEREACLQQVILSQQQRLATESEEEREARLQQLILNQQQRLATESQEEREARLHPSVVLGCGERRTIVYAVKIPLMISIFTSWFS